MSRDYYDGRRESSSVTRDRYSKYTEKDRGYRESGGASSRSATYDPEYDARNYTPTSHDRSRLDFASERNRDEKVDYYDKDISKERFIDNYTHYEEKKSKHKKSKHKKRSRDQERDEKRKSLVAAYDDISSDSDIQGTGKSPSSVRRISKAAESYKRANSPSTAIKEYQRIKERSHSNSPALREKSPSRSKGQKSKALSPEPTRKDSRDSKYRAISPASYSPSPKKLRYKSRTPSPER